MTVFCFTYKSCLYIRYHTIRYLITFFFHSMICYYLGEGNGSTLQYSYLENPMDRGVQWITALGSQLVHDLATTPPPPRGYYSNFPTLLFISLSHLFLSCITFIVYLYNYSWVISLMDILLFKITPHGKECYDEISCYTFLLLY